MNTTARRARQAEPDARRAARRHWQHFDETQRSGAFDGSQVTSDADLGL